MVRMYIHRDKQTRQYKFFRSKKKKEKTIKSSVTSGKKYFCNNQLFQEPLQIIECVYIQILPEKCSSIGKFGYFKLCAGVPPCCLRENKSSPLPSPGTQEQLTNNFTQASQPSAGNHYTSLLCLHEI